MIEYQKTLLEFVSHIINKHPELRQSILMLVNSSLSKESNELTKVFTNIFKSNHWRSSESVSGPGSELAYTSNLREKLPELFLKYDIKRVVDAPCGDFNWMRLVLESAEINYVGCDIVPDLISLNSEKYSSDRVIFKVLDITKDELPDADIIICRDCLFHLSFDNINKFIKNFLKSNIKYILTTSHHSRIVKNNSDIENGSFRLIDLYAEPFNFPKNPLEIIEDWIPGTMERQMLMWSRDQLLDNFLGKI